MSEIRKKIIARLNDNVRMDFIGNYKILFSRGFSDMSLKDGALKLIQEFDDFNEDNDPYGEHDFGSIDYKGKKIFWKIDYYDKTLENGSPDPADSELTIRVLTIMLAEEY